MTAELQLLERSVSDLKWFKEHSKELVKKYEGEFVAIKDESIVGHASQFDILIRRLQEQKIDTATVLIKYIPSQEEIIIL